MTNGQLTASTRVRLTFVGWVGAVSLWHALANAFREEVNPIAVTLFGLFSAFAWLIAALVNTLFENKNMRISNADVANAIAAVHAACLVIVSMTNSAIDAITSGTYLFFDNLFK